MNADRSLSWIRTWAVGPRLVALALIGFVAGTTLGIAGF